MVSKPNNSKRTTTKTIKHRRNHHLHRCKKHPVTTAAVKAVVASINKSIHTYRRRLIKIFSRLVVCATPKNKSSIKKGYKLLEKISAGTDDHISDVRRSLRHEPTAALPPPESPYKKTVFLDLDETLIHSKLAVAPSPRRSYDFIVKPVINGEIVHFYVKKRPFANEFLEFLIKNNFEIVVFTAGIEEYASSVLEKLDCKGLISHRLYRDSCKEVDGKYVKDLSASGRDLKKAVIVDDNPNSYGLQPENAIPIRPFTGDHGDGELKKLMTSGFFEKCDEFEDLRDALKNYIGDGDGRRTHF